MVFRNSAANGSVVNAYGGNPQLRNLRPLNTHDAEYHKVLYMLRASLSSLSVEVLTVHGINSPQQDATFEANHIGTTVLDSWVNSTDLPEENTIHNIIAHGGRFRITDQNKGAVFSVGLIALDTQNAPPGRQQYEMILCRIATGRSFVVDPEQVGVHGIPTGYDSIAIYQQPSSTAEDVAIAPAGSTTNKKTYFHEYILNDESRIYPAYVVNFMFDPSIDRLLENGGMATTAGGSLGGGTAVSVRDTKSLLDEMQSKVGTTLCPEWGAPLQFFDPVSHVPVCVKCKMVGSHSTGVNATHQLVSIYDAFQASRLDLEKEEQIINERRRTIHAQLGSIDKRMLAVNTNHERAQDEIYEIVQRAVQVLHEETQSKLSALLSDENELRRQLEYYDWMETFLKHHMVVDTPIAFLDNFKNHSALVALAPSEIVDSGSSVHADIRVVGRLEVVIDDTNPVLIQQQYPLAAATPPSSTNNKQQQPPKWNNSNAPPGVTSAAGLPQTSSNYRNSATGYPSQGSSFRGLNNANPRFAQGT